MEDELIVDLRQQELNDILTLFQDYHTFFCSLVDHFDVEFVKLPGRFSDNFPCGTAMVTYDKETKRINFLIDPTFWDLLPNFQTKVFVVAHEMCHLIFKHLQRFCECKDPDFNIAADVFVNHFIEKCFQINLQFQCPELYKDSCFVDTVFDGITTADYPAGLPTTGSTEFYYNYLKLQNKDQGQGQGSKKIKLVFDPFNVADLDGVQQIDLEELEAAGFEIEIGKESLNNIEKLIDQLKDQAGVEDDGGQDCDKKIGGQLAGSGAANKGTKVNVNIVRKKPWESIIRRWTRNATNGRLQKQPKWGYVHRRYGDLIKKSSSDIMIKGHRRSCVPEKKKIDVWLFLDNSGSCTHLRNRFFSAACAIPVKHFNVRAFSFDDRVYEIDLNKKEIRGGGGTSFTIIERKIQEIRSKENCAYPDQVFVITDGYGNKVYPEKPERWQWLLSVDARYCIPVESKIHKLDDYA